MFMNRSGFGDAAMFQFLRGIALIGVLILNCGAALAEVDLHSANNIMPGCRQWNAPVLGPVSDDLVKGICYGKIVTLVELSQNRDFCISSASVTDGQFIRVVVQYIDSRPARQHEDFLLLAREALQAAWPCKK